MFYSLLSPRLAAAPGPELPRSIVTSASEAIRGFRSSFFDSFQMGSGQFCCLQKCRNIP